jgi:phosphoribosylaminoimidazole carboxylase/phosphoribosylaminoimidazole-succinocarboxamide synthase
MSTDTVRTPIAEGKTKRIMRDDDPAFCRIESKNDITAHDDPSLTREFGTKAVSATATTCRMFELLRDAGLPVAYDTQLSPTTFRAQLCRMIPLECVARRHAAGSYLQREWGMKDGQRFHRLTMEFFLKTTKGQLRTVDGAVCLLDLLAEDDEEGVDDPLIADPYEASEWELVHPKRPATASNSLLQSRVTPAQVLPPGVTALRLEELTRRAFLVLERAWGMLGCRLIDYKIEFGVDTEGVLRIADVIDNDSWRMRTNDGKEVSKQLFRDGHPLAEVEEKYAVVARLAERARVPRQALALWTASGKDAYPEYPQLLPGVTVRQICCSAHKSPGKAIEILDSLMYDYPEGGAIVALVGMSNGLGPTLSARTTWPVVNVPLRYETHVRDVWSCLDLPSNVPASTVASPANAVLHALNGLAQSNPALYARLRYDIEERDA